MGRGSHGVRMSIVIRTPSEQVGVRMKFVRSSYELKMFLLCGADFARAGDTCPQREFHSSHTFAGSAASAASVLVVMTTS